MMAAPELLAGSEERASGLRPVQGLVNLPLEFPVMMLTRKEMGAVSGLQVMLHRTQERCLRASSGAELEPLLQ